MIELNCTNCNKVLSIDDAFAGGVCRCQHCGTIQTVPAKGSHAAHPAAVAATADTTSPKPLYKRKARIESALSPFNDGLDEAADQIPSSGLSNSSLISGVHRRPSAVSDVPLSGQMPMSGMNQPAGAPLADPPVMDAATAAARHAAHHPANAAHVRASHRRLIVATIGAVLALAFTGAAWWLLTHGETQANPDGDKAALKHVDENSDVPQFATVPLDGSSVTYILDRSGCSNQTFSEMVRLCGKSLASLGSQRQFRVLVMGADKAIVHPASGSKNATVAARDAFLDAFGNEVYVGQKNAPSVFQKALEIKTDSLVLISANDDHASLVEMLSPVLGEKPRPIQVFYLGSSDSSPGLQALAQATGGNYYKVNLAAIK